MTTPASTNSATAPRRRLRRRRALVGAVALIGALAASAGLRDRAPENRTERVSPTPLAVSVMRLEHQQQYQQSRTYLGRVEPARRARIGFELAGELAAIRVDEGASVRRGEVLATLNTDRLDARRRELAAALALARAELDLARATRTRIRNLSGRGHASEQRRDEADERYLAASAAFDLADARIQSLDTERAKSKLRAPFDAKVVVRHLDEGRVVSPGTAVLSLQEQRDPQVRIGLPARAADRIRPDIAYRLSGAGRVFSGRPRTVLPVAGEGTRIVDVLFDIAAAPGALRAGELVELKLRETVAAPGAWVPLDALTAGRRGTWVLYGVRDASTSSGSARDPSLATVTPITVQLIAQDGARAYVRGGFADGDRVIVHGLNRVVPGQRVAIDGALAGGA